MKSAVAVENRKVRPKRHGLRLLVLAVLLFVLVLVFSGCSSQHPGETVAETNRRHDRVLRLNNQMLMSDIDTALMLDRPSRLTDKRLP